MISDSWIVKYGLKNLPPELVEEEQAYVTDNPHAEQLLKIFDLAQIDFGRIDYCVANGRIEVFEINTNPQFPRATIANDQRMARRKIVIEGIVDGFRHLDPPHDRRGLARFRTPKPKLHRLRDRSLRRRVVDWMTYCRWRSAYGAPIPPAKRRKPGA
jgi:hypothetical protein